MKNCSNSIAGGKGNKCMFIERDTKVCAAGLPSSQPEQCVKDFFKHYCLQDEVDALVRDSIIPPPKLRVLPPLRHQPRLDMRNAGGSFTETAQLINPPVKTKFQTLVEDFKSTNYKSYWNKPVGCLPDQVASLPLGLNIVRTTMGIKTPDHGRLYDVVMPTNPVPDKTPAAKTPGYQKDRNYCRPSYNPHMIFGLKTPADLRGRYVKCRMTDDRITLGTLNKPINARQADFVYNNQARLGLPLAPNADISKATSNSFKISEPSDNVPKCLTTCEMNPIRNHFKKCLGHLNTLRICLKKRFDGSFFRGLYLSFKYHDKSKSGWLPKEVVYDFCFAKFIRFEASLVEPLLATWNAFDGRQIEYKTFVLMLNHTVPTPDLPKVWDVSDECIDFRTTYSEMVKPGQEVDKKLMAGLPSARYFDLDHVVTPAGYCKADRSYLPDESDAKSCLLPSVFTNLGISHRDMYATHPPEKIRNIFEAASKEKFSDEKFETVWREAKNYHSRGKVCCETFRRALDKYDEHKRKD